MLSDEVDDAGPTDIPILEETIGENFERIVRRTRTRRRSSTSPATGAGPTASSTPKSTSSPGVSMALGVDRGERVGIWAPNCAEWTIVQYATAKIGAILVNINPAYRTHELAYVLKQSGVRTLISATAFKTSDYVGMVEEVRPESPTPSGTSSSWAPTTGSRLRPRRPRPDDELRSRMAALTNTEPINIQYTSGTTGFPKGATLSHRNILNNGFFVTELINLRARDRLCIPVPFYHCFGMVMGNLGCTTHGATMVIPAPGFDPGLTLAAIDKERCTGVYGVPTMFIAMLGHPISPHATCRRCAPASWRARCVRSR